MKQALEAEEEEDISLSMGRDFHVVVKGGLGT